MAIMKKNLFLLVTAFLVISACNGSGEKKPSGSDTPSQETTDPEKPDTPETPETPEPGPATYRLGTYNIGNFNKTETNSTGMVADMMKEIGVQVLSMNELDYFNQRHNVNQIANFASLMGGWKSFFAPAISYKGGQYGIGVASAPELTVLRTEALTLAKGDGSEQRACAVVEFEPFVFASTHLDHKSKDAQLEQAKTIEDWMEKNYGASEKPVFLCGDFNALPTSETIRFMEKNWTILSPLEPTYNAINPSKCIDYIMVYKNAAAKVKKLDAKVMRTFASGNVEVASDHLPVFVDVELAR